MAQVVGTKNHCLDSKILPYRLMYLCYFVLSLNVWALFIPQGKGEGDIHGCLMCGYICEPSQAEITKALDLTILMKLKINALRLMLMLIIERVIMARLMLCWIMVKDYTGRPINIYPRLLC